MAAPTTEREVPSFSMGQERTVQLDGSPSSESAPVPGSSNI